MIITGDLIQFEASDVAQLSQRMQNALKIFSVPGEQMLSNVVNQALAQAFSRATLQQIASASDAQLQQLNAILDTVPVVSSGAIVAKPVQVTTPPITPPLT